MQRGERVVRALRRGPRGHPRVDLVAPADALRRGGIARVFGDVGPSDQRGQALPVRVEQHAGQDVAVAAAVGVGGRGDAELVAEARQRDAERAEREVARRLEEHGVEQRDVDVLALAGGVAVVQRRHRPDHGDEAGQVVGEERRRLVRLALHRPVERHPAAGGQRGGVVPGPG